MNHFNAFAGDLVENQIVAVRATPNSVTLVARHERERCRHVGQAVAAVKKFFGEGLPTLRIVLADVLLDVYEIICGPVCRTRKRR
jgi:hypothetical protein